ncbi:hypothetical protein TdN_10610 [Thermodesulfovibrio sp. TK110]
MTTIQKTLSKKELEEAIIQEKMKGVSDVEIGRKYGISFKYLEKIITRTQGISISSLKQEKKIKTFYPKDFKEETTTVWSFKQRGNWATHSGEYRGNWSPYITRNLILKYSKPGSLVLDYFCGAGTTAVECKLLGRRCIAFDINDKAIELAKRNLNFEPAEQLKISNSNEKLEIFEPHLFVGDARDLSFLKDNSVDLICSHPPYANAIHYTARKEGDLSFCDVDEFLEEMSKVAKESYRVLKPGSLCAILIGDIRRKKHVIPLGFKLIDVFLNTGFKLKELIIKRQHNCKTTGFWYEKSIKYNFLLLAHEYLPVFEKPEKLETSVVKEIHNDYHMVLPKISNTKIKKKLEKLETTTVWIFPEKDFDERLNKNIIERYSQEGNYSIINLFASSGSILEIQSKLRKKQTKNKYDLIIVKACVKDKSSGFEPEDYLKSFKKIIEGLLPELKDKGFLVIQTNDVRINGYLEPLAQKIVNLLTNKNLWLKEIVVVTTSKVQEETVEGPQKVVDFLGCPIDHLKIIHEYLLVYEVLK